MVPAEQEMKGCPEWTEYIFCDARTLASPAATGDWNFRTHTVATAARTREPETPAAGHPFKGRLPEKKQLDK